VQALNNHRLWYGTGMEVAVVTKRNLKKNLQKHQEKEYLL